ncbi:MAG: hypothetical protein QXE99_04190 [Acidilobaceae archaeon]
MDDCVSIIVPTTKNSIMEIKTIEAIIEYKQLNPNTEIILQPDYWHSASRTRSEGARRSKCGILVFMDDDIYVKPETIEYYVMLARKGYTSIVCNDGKLSKNIFTLLSRLLVTNRDLGVLFDNSILFNQSEDVEFIFKCLSRGVKIACIRPQEVKHYGAEGRLRKYILNSFNSTLLAIRYPHIIYSYFKSRKGRLKSLLYLIKFAILGRTPKTRQAPLLTSIGLFSRVAGYIYYLVVSRVISLVGVGG